MKKIATVSLALLLVVGVTSVVLAHGPGFGRGNGGYGYGMGPGMMHGYGGGGYGMMGPGYGARGYDQTCWSQGTQGLGEEITKENAKTFLEDRLAYLGNPNLKVGKIKEKDTNFEGEIVTKKGNSLVQRLQIDKETGLIRPVY